ncbi:hypothetical protein [Chitinophaga oryziterrae]|uniref:hypothetical protein n=1 Tax=Chitinophaga oryziterrae TaxID=1031224 RepID=UPI0031D1FE41
MKQFIPLIIVLCICSNLANAQDSTLEHLPKKYLSQVEHKSRRFEEQIDKRTDKALARLIKQEQKMKSRLWKIDSVGAKTIFNSSVTRIADLKKGLQSKLPAGGDAYLDTLQHTLKFLGQAGNTTSQLTNAMQSVQQLQGKLQYSEQVKNYINQRKQMLKEQLAQYTGFTKNLQKINKEAYYYGEQLKEYKSVYSDPKKAEVKAMALLKKLPVYNDFISKHSQLAGLFNLAGSYNDTRSLEGLQTRTQVEQLVQQRIGSSPDAGQVISQQMEQARFRFNELKSKYPALNSAADMPDFRPREMKTKTFFQRLEPGGNIQFQKSNQYFPTTADIAAQIAYKLNKNSSAGIGLSYKLGMGSGWNHIAFSHQGVGLRTFGDYRLKGTFFINAGFEGNRNTGFKYLSELKHWNGWTTSALAGISKKYKINAKLKGNIMLLYDFLAPRQLPKTDNIKLRIGYSL